MTSALIKLIFGIALVVIAIAIGPLLLGVAKPIHILTPAATVRRIVNVTTLAVVEAASNARGIA